MTKLTLVLLILTLETLFKGCHSFEISDQQKSMLKQIFSERKGCWLTSLHRGFGKLPDCGRDQHQSARLCYNKCPSGYDGKGPFCVPSPFYYSRDGYFSFKDCGEGEQKSGLYCYPKCQPGFNSWGLFCISERRPYWRGVGEVPSQCNDWDRSMDEGLCYRTCPKNYDGVMNLCWGQVCPESYPYKCGYLCMEDKLQCGLMATELSLQGIAIPVSLAMKQFPAAIIASISLVHTLSSWNQCASL